MTAGPHPMSSYQLSALSSQLSDLGGAERRSAKPHPEKKSWKLIAES
jgi:hypothetical protein